VKPVRHAQAEGGLRKIGVDGMESPQVVKPVFVPPGCLERKDAIGLPDGVSRWLLQTTGPNTPFPITTSSTAGQRPLYFLFQHSCGSAAKNRGDWIRTSDLYVPNITG